MSAPTRTAIALLDRLEEAEARLLTWGCVDATFTELEVVTAAAEEFERIEGRPAEDSEAEALLEELGRLTQLWRDPYSGGYRTRMGEAVRLFSRLRQIFPGSNPSRWRDAPHLVADYRFQRRQRTYPDRALDGSAVLNASPAINAFVGGAQVLGLLLGGGQGIGVGQKLARFQVDATQRILHQLHELESNNRARSSGTIVCAGTGSGKTKAFYLPALIAMAHHVRNGDDWTKAIAIYPRNELLKDQIRAALDETRKITPWMVKAGRRPIVIGALFGDTPDHSRARRIEEEWRPASGSGGRGRCCDFVRCPACGEAMVWLDDDRRRLLERLVCMTGSCNTSIEPDRIRLTRDAMRRSPPDILFVSTEMLNQRLWDSDHRHLFGVGARKKPLLLLLDEVHTYEGASGAQVAYLLRRWLASSQATPHIVGLSATLSEASQFFADLTGLSPAGVEKIEPAESELLHRDAEYQLALRGDPASQASLLSTSIQSLMLLRRILSPTPDDPLAGSRAFAFADNLDVVNRLYHDTLDAEGWWAPGRPRSGRMGSLANERASNRPHEIERFQHGQNWRMVEDIGHGLGDGSRGTVSRTSSQDAGVDRASGLVVATSSLEVGFDDPEVGAVLQHKAPRSAAPFLQRRGRAGRRLGSRPWTIVTLSDFGRDRVAYQAYDQLFSPVLPARFLPLRNRAVLRMQATYVLLDWLAQRCGPGQVHTWAELTGPTESSAWGGSDPSRRARQLRHVEPLRDLLSDSKTRLSLRDFVARQLNVDRSEADALLWEPPRAVLMEAVPTLLRRIEADWARADGGKDLAAKWNPLPDFVQKTLFGELLVPEVAIRIFDGGGREVDREESMLIRQALVEFSPGRVSRRFGDRDARSRQWIDPGASSMLQLDGFCKEADRAYIGEFQFIEGATVRSIPVYRPHAIEVRQPPDEVKTASNGRPDWKTQIVEVGHREPIGFPPSPEWGGLLDSMTVHAHAFSNPVEVRRFVSNGNASVLRGSQRIDQRWTFATPNGKACALGFAADVDAVKFVFRYPSQLEARCNERPVLLRALRVARFRDLIESAPALAGLTNIFQRARLADAWLAALTLGGLKSGEDLATVAALLGTPEGAGLIRSALDRLHLWGGGDDEDGVEGGDDGDNVALPAGGPALPKRLAELQQLLANLTVLGVLRAASNVLSSDVDNTWTQWLRERYRATIGAAVHVAAQDLCPRMGADAVVLDLPDEGEVGDGVQGVFWLTETTLGGGAFVEEFQARVEEDPRRFMRLVRGALDPSDIEAIGEDLERLVPMLAALGQDQTVQQAVEAMRVAETHASKYQALRALRERLAQSGITTTRPFMVALQSRVLAPGTSARTDGYLDRLLSAWTVAEARLGIDVDGSAMALAFAEDTSLEAALGLPPDGATEQERAVWRHSVIRGMLWPRGGSLRSTVLQVENVFTGGPPCDRLLALAALDEGSLEVNVCTPSWFEEFAARIACDGTVRLVAPAAEHALLSRAIGEVAMRPVEVGGIQVHARITGIRRGVGQWTAMFELREAYQ